MKTGIVFEIHQSKAIIMKTDGEFLTVPAAKDWKIGDVVTIQEQKSIKFLASRKLLVLAASLLFLALGGFYGGKIYFTRAALISLDVNPSIEIEINRFGRILSVYAKNDEGETILESAKMKNRAYEDAMLTLFQQEELKIYFQPESYVYLTVQAEDEKLEQELLNQMENYKTAIQAHHDTITVEYCSVESELVEQAHEHGLTAGKYKILMELAELDPGIDLSEYAHHSVGDLVETMQEKCSESTDSSDDLQSEDDWQEDMEHDHHGFGH